MKGACAVFMWKTAVTGIIAGIVFGTGLFFVLRSANPPKFEKQKAYLVTARVKEETRWRHHYRYSRYRYSRFTIRPYKVYAPEVEYIYTVDGKAYRGSRFIYPGSPVYTSYSEALAALRDAGLLRGHEQAFDRRVGGTRQIEIRYNPKKPHISAVVVKPPEVWPYGWVLVFVSIFLLGVMWLFFMSERNRLEEWESQLKARLRESGERGPHR